MTGVDVATIKEIAVIGFGSISNRHRMNLRTLFPDALIVGLSSTGREPLESPSNLDITLPNVQALLDRKPYFVIVASPATMHFQHSAPLIEKGVPVLIEKPLTEKGETSEFLYHLVRNSNSLVAVAYCLRYRRALHRVKQVLNNKIIGDVLNVSVDAGQYLPDWRPNVDFKNTVSARKELGGGALLELSHELDYIQFLFGELKPISAIIKSSKHLGLDVDDIVDFVCETTDDTVIAFHLDFLKREAVRRCTVSGTNGEVEWNLLTDVVTLKKAAKIETIYEDSKYDANNMYLEMLRDFERSIQVGSNGGATVEESLKTIKLIDQLKEMGVNNGVEN